MADTPVPQSSARRIPVIVFERPPLDWGRLILGVLLGLALGAVLGLGQWWLAGLGADDLASEWLLAPHARYTIPLAVLGLVAGVAIGWSWKREQQARIELVEVAPTVRETHRRRRRAISTELESHWG